MTSDYITYISIDMCTYDSMCNHFQGLVLFVGAVIYNIQHNRRARLVGTKSKTALEGVIHAKINHASGGP